MAKLSVFIISFVTLLSNIAIAADSSGKGNTQLVFQSGFEPDSILVAPSSKLRDIIGVDSSVSAPNDWALDLDQNPHIGYWKIELKDGTSQQRDATLTGGSIIGNTDKPDQRNTYLHFFLQEAHEPASEPVKGRVQANLTNLVGVTEVYQRIRFYLTPDFNLLKSYPGTFSWLTLFEFWNDPNWGDLSQFPFRIKIDIQKRTSGNVDELYWGIKAQRMDSGGSSTVWEVLDQSYPVAIGQWVSAEIYFKEGDEQNGRFYFALKGEHGPKKVICDQWGYTQHPKDTSPNDGLPFFNPMKLYTRGTTIDHVRNSGGALQVYWDDWQLYLNQ